MAVVRMVILSDTHGQHRDVRVPNGDLLIHCGDWTKSSSKPKVEDYQDFVSWMVSLPHPTKVVVSGNKEIFMDTESCLKHQGKSLSEIESIQQLLMCDGLNYLCESGFLFHKSDVHLRLWGSPWTRRNGKDGKAFQVEAEQMKEKWEKVRVENVSLEVTPLTWCRFQGTQTSWSPTALPLAGLIPLGEGRRLDAPI